MILKINLTVIVVLTIGVIGCWVMMILNKKQETFWFKNAMVLAAFTGTLILSGLIITIWME
jgi:hypothetical protein